MTLTNPISAPEETVFSFTIAVEKAPAPATAAANLALPVPLAEDGEEWEGFYDDGEYEEL